jgi:acyl carrier protein
MTIEEVVAIVDDETGKKVSADTELSTLGMDSLDFISLIVRVGNIPDAIVPQINTVNDLWVAANGEL